MTITKQEKENIFKKFGDNVKNSGSVYSQVALFTANIKNLSTHLKKNRKD